ncbi:ABC transporter permease [Bacillus thermotolerans]|uniref:ABC transporter, permease protein n=1 Tax=Bacillus thermotolerans TaxID=1221996 RepID=A0A0F5ICF8_BACTR|nr:ABC transporter permease [Bacillus thermotolerans]KKB43138.1 ABC transporter, permease protein [Bacillus thermotolerans]KKB43541.1 ABC transporter, permease protein [Bacillus thermotolerans]
MIGLIKNEWLKLVKQRGTRVMIALLVLITCLFAGLMKYEESHQADSPTPGWQEKLQAENAAYKKELTEEQNLTEVRKDYLEGQININEYRLQHNLPVDTDMDMQSFVEGSSDLLSFAGLFVLIAAAGIVANEHTWGTIKLLLTRPVSRVKILFSKYAAVILFGLFLLAVAFTLSSLLGLVLFGASGSSIHLAYENGQVVEQSMIFHLLKVYVFKFVDVLMFATLAFMVSAVFRSSSLAIGLSSFLLFIGPTVTMLLSMRYEWTKYLLFANTDLLQFEEGRTLVSGMTMEFSLVVLAVYYAVFQILAFIVFSKRDVAA